MDADSRSRPADQSFSGSTEHRHGGARRGMATVLTAGLWADDNEHYLDFHGHAEQFGPIPP